MARLRREEEARAYERMLKPPDAYATASFAQVHRPVSAADADDDGVTLSDVNRQVMLVLNFVLTMGGVAYALWMLARWWPTPSRLFLAMGGSIATGLVEYGLYAGYVWHLGEAAKRDSKAAKEVRAVVNTWAVGPGGTDNVAEKAGTAGAAGRPTPIPGATTAAGAAGASGIDSARARRRKKEASSKDVSLSG